MDYKTWRHAFKIDPAKSISDDHVEMIAESGTDGVIIGGSDGVTLENVLDLLARFRRFSVPLALEVSTVESVTPGFDYYFIPTVLNTTDSKWLNGLHHEALREYGHMMNFDELVTEGYCILNPDCTAAKVTGVDCVPDEEDVQAYARMAEHLFSLPIFYLEYSGQYGDPQIVRSAKELLTNTRLFYGGGIRSTEQAKEMAAIADTVVVGNVVYDDLQVAIKTVDAVKSVPLPV
ncbi:MULTISPECIES: heptaprenylglyceryl phosphate synthase [unclassified Sporosarcina]|uniref:heptaprenylglyceryl phosphate synthase n=1 Tax=unclassified Sporosarcina TaxID=2647733 RepID=UPI000C16E55A|nr:MULTISPECIES: heptaprenylglyceryl phosphate synthase [unclassified Sporosarcina]PID04597.1 geranylgeranylglyceryl/heptaprenylglyceryl phosphate synthase [Sporosarcina sp. P30]PID07739.1 geranylgeranylglyceryl/heptaprenylglyceryl phosphate synthase [Sporosarcina sp. P31]PID10937.1 geranylgeranylglyceryl/heptaprenylglyceryl phosphate synthase [Sporosarcina sp. P32b]